MRAIAVFAVFIFHAFPRALRGGFVGVDIFFVISGFLISSIIFSHLESTSFSFWNFYSRRIRRIYPTLIIVVLSVLAFGFFSSFLATSGWLFYVSPLTFAQIGKHVAGGASFISNFVLWFESGYFDSGTAGKPLLHLWSLGIEEQFYIIWPLLLWLLWKKRFNLLVVSVIFAVLSFGLNLYFNKVDPVADFFSPLTRFWELLIGAMLAWVFLHPAQLTFKPGLFYRETSLDTTPEMYSRFYRYRHILSTIGVVVLIASILFIRETGSRKFPGIWALFPVFGTLLIIAAGKDGWFNKWVLSNRILVWLGLISYPLYLWHWPLLSFARIIENTQPPLWWRLIAFPLAIGLAWLTTKCVENPLRFGKHGAIKTISLFVVMVLIGSAGLFSYVCDGFLSRSPAPIQTLETINRLSAKTNEGYRDDCHMDPDTNLKSQKADYTSCRLNLKDPSKPTMLIWGDSHAAMLIPGMLKHFGEKYNIVQRSIAGCQPVFAGSSSSICQKTHEAIFSELTELKPQKVILGAYWGVENDSEKYKKLETTISKLHSVNINDIVIIGQMPRWKGFLPSLLASEYMKTGQIPDMLEPYHFDRLKEMDTDLAALSQKWRVSYISPIRLLCKDDGCKTMASDDPDSVMYFDDDHLTGKGSEYLVSRFKKDNVFSKKRH